MASVRQRNSGDQRMLIDRNGTASKTDGDGGATTNAMPMPGKTHASDYELVQTHHTTTLKDVLNLIFCAGGILVCYFYFGVAQESITKSKYGENKEKFVYTQALVFIQCVINGIFAIIMMRVQRQGQDNTPWYLYALCAFSYLAAMISSNHSLQYVPYPTQVLGKSCKPIPIMVFGVLFARKRYPPLKYLFVLMIVAGVAMFLYKEGGEGKSTKASEHFTFGWGEILLVMSLAMDGTTGAIQEKIRALYHFKSHNMMFRMNLWSTIYLLIGLVATGELFEFVVFVEKYPHVLVNMVGLSVASALGQYFIFKTVADFGPLPCSIITTTRKLFTILASVILFQNPMTANQWSGTIIVFIGLTLDGAFGKTKGPPRPAKH